MRELRAPTMFFRFCLCLLLCALMRPARAAVDWPAQRGNFALCLLNAPSGFWVGTEDNGLWRRDARGQWQQFTAQNGLGGDTVRCLLSRGNQIWAGHARDGLSIWDGARWSHLGVEDGLPSERVNALAVGENGDVWVATDGGLCRWNDNGGWTVPGSELTRRQIVALACARGEVWAATACDGLLKSSDAGASWTQIRGAPVQPDTATGAGLPSDVLNDVAVDELGQIWVATDLGLARSGDEGASWFFLRGADWQANVEGSAQGLAPHQSSIKVELPGEDWVQSLAPDGDGHLWVGLRQQGAEMRDIQSGELIFGTRFNLANVAAPVDDWVRAIYPLDKGRAIVARYGGGVGGILDAELPAPAPQTKDAALKVPGAFPVLGAESLRQLANPPAPGLVPVSVAAGLWNMDYRTRGDWVGRYGDRLAWVYEQPWPREFARDPGAHFEVRLGPHAKTGGPYTYIAFLGSDNPDVLYNPAIGTRRMDEINDGTWQHNSYPFSWEGPGLWVSVEVPAGAHRVALYFYNNDGHNGLNRYRDYILQLKPWANDLEDADASPDLARCRVSDFWAGVYASFAVPGPGKYWIKVARHRSHVAKFSAIFLDRIGTAAPDAGATAGATAADELPRPSMRGIAYDTQPVPAPAGAQTLTVAAARAAWQALDHAAATGAPAAGEWQRRLQLLRAAQAAGADPNLLFNWRWKLGIWTKTDRVGFAATMAQIEAQRQQQSAAAKTAKTP